MIEKAYDAWSETYDRVANPTRDLDAVVMSDLGDLFKNKNVLEIGCGTGKNTVRLAGLAGNVTAMDFSRGMLTRAEAKIGQSANVKFQKSDITAAWPVKERSFDVVVCNLVLEHVRDLDFVFAQADKALAPGGLFVVCEYHPYKQYQGKQANFKQDGRQVDIEAHIHDVSEFASAALGNGFAVQRLDEWRDNNQPDQPPRLISFVFEKGED